MEGKVLLEGVLYICQVFIHMALPPFISIPDRFCITERGYI